MTGAGKGLFATRDIAQGELITLYPGDAVVSYEDADHTAGSNAQIFFGKHVLDQDVQRYAKDLKMYEIPATHKFHVIADPLLCDDAAYLGHMANDAACCVSVQDRARYEEETAKGSNAEHISVQGCHVATHAVNDIEKGQEIFVSYGYGHWSQYFLT